MHDLPSLEARRNYLRQVSWLAGHHAPAAFPFPGTVDNCAGRSLLTVAGPRGNFTRFPFHSLSDEHLRDCSIITGLGRLVNDVINGL